jgi:catechol 2,3-dioxygenase-like lactoylglutathione lyase family enzyme
MPVKVGWSTPMLHSSDMRRSIAFYEKLGFELIDDDASDGRPPGWARMHCQGGALMFLGPEEPDEAPVPRKFHDRFILFMYTPDLKALREQLVAAGIDCPAIKHPPYAAAGDLFFKDPDGYPIEIVHWGKEEDERWEKHLAKRKQERG